MREEVTTRVFPMLRKTQHPRAEALYLLLLGEPSYKYYYFTLTHMVAYSLKCFFISIFI